MDKELGYTGKVLESLDIVSEVVPEKGCYRITLVSLTDEPIEERLRTHLSKTDVSDEKVSQIELLSYDSYGGSHDALVSNPDRQE